MSYATSVLKGHYSQDTPTCARRQCVRPRMLVCQETSTEHPRLVYPRSPAPTRVHVSRRTQRRPSAPPSVLRSQPGRVGVRMSDYECQANRRKKSRTLWARTNREQPIFRRTLGPRRGACVRPDLGQGRRSPADDGGREGLWPLRAEEGRPRPGKESSPPRTREWRGPRATRPTRAGAARGTRRARRGRPARGEGPRTRHGGGPRAARARRGASDGRRGVRRGR